MYTLKENDLSGLKTLNLDIIYTIHLRSSEPENLSEAARFGLWHIHFGHGAYRSSSIPGFWEVMDNSPVTGSYMLMRQNGRDYILYDGSTPSVPFSVKNNFNSIAWKSASYLEHRLNSLSEMYDRFAGIFKSKELSFDWTKRGIPGNTTMAFLFTKNLFGYLKYKFKDRFFRRRFTLLYSLNVFDFKTLETVKFQPVTPPKNVFFADPFIIKKNDIHFIFFEEFNFSKGKAHISVLEIDSTGKVGLHRPVIEKPYHLSYPFVFEIEGEYYMIPETSANKTVEVYKAAAFPDKWIFVMNLIEGRGFIDSTFFFKDGLWWLFANRANHPFVSTNDQLFLYYSESLLSDDWKPHPMNPIATHAENCRPAGRIFERDNKIYRPAQNNASSQYGFGIKFNEIQILNTYEYKEMEGFTFDSHAMGLKAIHHFDFTSNFIVIDGIVK